MNSRGRWTTATRCAATLCVLAAPAVARADPPPETDARFEVLQRRVAEQARRLEALKRSVADEEAEVILFEPDAVRNTGNVVDAALTAPAGVRL